ncbi:hypothetical protein AAC03nite_16970 [Alicyclobacillus acidoterrestris]|nr:hypothetical protein AAC03nite_16970 [Alicyclobacillus acidoterrestris]
MNNTSEGSSFKATMICRIRFTGCYDLSESWGCEFEGKQYISEESQHPLS